MGFWFFMFVISLLIPLSMIGIGYLFVKKPPKDINYFVGYRTSMSMINRDTWDFAHHYFGKLWFKWGIIILPLTLIAMGFLIGKDMDTISTISVIICFIQMLPMIGPIFPTERALRRTFDKNGARKSNS